MPGNRVRFWHLTFQEFLAARQLAWMDDDPESERGWWRAISPDLDDAQWRETADFLPGCLLQGGGEGRVDKLLERVLAPLENDDSLPTVARVTGIVGRLVQPLHVYDYRPPPEVRRRYQAALEQSPPGCRTPRGGGQSAVTQRIQCAEALGRGGNPRLGSNVDNVLEVPGLDGVKLGKYPVTVEEFRHFVDHRGYEHEDCWDDEGRAFREKYQWDAPLQWDEQILTHQPACRWRLLVRGSRLLSLAERAARRGVSTTHGSRVEASGDERARPVSVGRRRAERQSREFRTTRGRAHARRRLSQRRRFPGGHCNLAGTCGVVGGIRGGRRGSAKTMVR